MPLTSDLTLNVGKFDPASASEQSKKLNAHLIEILENSPKWWEVGAAKYREMRWKGETALPAPKVLPDGIDIKIPSRDAGRDIPCRIMYPTERKTVEERKKCKGVIIHFHGGGWVIGDEKSHDALLLFQANTADAAVISVGYRLAPEDPFPAGPEDCYDAADYLVKNADAEYGGPVKFIGGESAGAHLSILTAYHLLTHHPNVKLSGLFLHFGSYDLSTGFPSLTNFDKTLVLSKDIVRHFNTAFLPNKSYEEKMHPSISPYYENLEKYRGRLPPALFTCGTEDPLLDDSVMMATKWMMAGGEAVLKIYSGAPHGFIGYVGMLDEARQGLEDTKAFILEKVGRA